jgi:hypothetical protein
MASSGKQKTTWSKIQRESRLRERRLDKAARKEARKNAPAEPELTGPVLDEEFEGAPESDGERESEGDFEPAADAGEREDAASGNL